MLVAPVLVMRVGLVLVLLVGPEVVILVGLVLVIGRNGGQDGRCLISFGSKPEATGISLRV